MDCGCLTVGEARTDYRDMLRHRAINDVKPVDDGVAFHRMLPLLVRDRLVGDHTACFGGNYLCDFPMAERLRARRIADSGGARCVIEEVVNCQFGRIACSDPWCPSIAEAVRDDRLLSYRAPVQDDNIFVE